MSPTPLPSTDRLRLRRLRPGDHALLDVLDRDEDVLQFIDRHPPTLQEQEREVARLLAETEHRPDHGVYIAESPEGEFLGWFSLHVQKDPHRLNLGYRLRRRTWGTGLATEGSRALIDFAFGHLGADVVEADTMFVNAASRRVMEKCGMRHVETFHVHFEDPLPGTDLGEVRYEISRSSWLQRRGR